METEDKSKDFVYVKVRIKRETHEKVKKLAKREKRSMNFMFNDSTELYVSIKGRDI